MQSLYPGLEWTQNGNNRNIYLTFDDGPQPEITQFVLNTLAQFNAKATFFCVGENVMRYPEIAAQIQAQGHTLANHSHNHLKGWNTEAHEYVKNVIQAGQFIPNKIFRPPYGRITRRQINLLKAAGFRIIMWNLLSCDYVPQLNREKSLKSLTSHTVEGSIIVFHDSIKAAENMRWILPRYMEAMQDKGFNFAAI